MDERHGVSGGNYHEVASFHHKLKAETYAQLGFDKKATRHWRRAEWHAAFGPPPPPPPSKRPPPAPATKGAGAPEPAWKALREKTERLDAKYLSGIDSSYLIAIAAIDSVLETQPTHLRKYGPKSAQVTNDDFAASRSSRALKSAQLSAKYEAEAVVAEPPRIEKTISEALKSLREPRRAKATISPLEDEENRYKKVINPLEDENMAYRNVKAAQESLRKFADSVRAYCKGLVVERVNLAEYRSSHENALSYITRLSDAWDIMRQKLEQQITAATKRLEGLLGNKSNKTVDVDSTEFQEGALVKKAGGAVKQLPLRSGGTYTDDLKSLHVVRDGMAMLNSLKVHFQTYCATSPEARHKAESERAKATHERVLRADTKAADP
jgi:hypothetical protein